MVIQKHGQQAKSAGSGKKSRFLPVGQHPCSACLQITKSARPCGTALPGEGAGQVLPLGHMPQPEALRLTKRCFSSGRCGDWEPPDHWRCIRRDLGSCCRCLAGKWLCTKGEVVHIVGSTVVLPVLASPAPSTRCPTGPRIDLGSLSPIAQTPQTDRWPKGRASTGACRIRLKGGP